MTLDRNQRRAAAVLAGVYALVLAYSLVMRGSILLGLLPAVVGLPAYFVWRFLRVLERIADALERITAELERDAAD